MQPTRSMLTAGVLAIAIVASAALAQPAPASGPYKVLKTSKVGGAGGFDYVYADSDGRRLYIPRGATSGATPVPARVSVFDLDTLAPAGEIANANARGAAVDPRSGHGFATSKPVVMWDSKTLATLKTIDVEGGPDGILFDHFNQRIYILSHRAPNATVIDSKDGSVVGAIDLGGAPEQAVTDGKGHIYVDIEDKDNVAVIDAKTMAVTAHYDLNGKGGTPAGLAFDARNRILFVACRTPAPGVMVMLNADTGKIVTTLPLDGASDGAVFNPATNEAFSSAGNGTLTVIKENSASSFVVEQTVQTMPSAKTLTLDSRTNHILLIGAEFGPAPTPPPANGRPSRGPMLPDSFSIVVVGK
jgi:DNA-binding beta-propeller fold protein YncE